MTMFNIFGRSSKTISLRSKKNQGHTTRQTDYMAGNVQKFGFLKIHSQNRIGEVQGYASKSLFFEGETFFKGLQKIFYASYDHVQYIWKFVLDHIFTLEKNWGHTTRQTDYMAGNVQKFGFLKIHSQNRVGEVQSYASKSLFLKPKLFFKGLQKIFYASYDHVQYIWKVV